MNYIECIANAILDLAGRNAFAWTFIKISSLYKYASLFV
jgi:hypothetical protein